ncbi:hypothetical protein KBI23_09440 [bacterium]|nr:hypothetical protein [bacterium]MBP9810525.1 hypothetical protein [bacterium]
MKQTKLLKFAFSVSVLLIASCATLDFSKASYLNGRSQVKYEQTIATDWDNITIKIFEPGTYHVAFSKIPAQNSTANTEVIALPQDFDITVEKAPWVHFIYQHYLPTQLLRVTITHNGQTEWHDFK